MKGTEGLGLVLRTGQPGYSGHICSTSTRGVEAGGSRINDRFTKFCFGERRRK